MYFTVFKAFGSFFLFFFYLSSLTFLSSIAKWEQVVATNYLNTKVHVKKKKDTGEW